MVFYTIWKNIRNLVISKILSLLEELENTPTTGTGKPEKLKGYEERNVWSRRIDQKHCLVYEISEETNSIELLTCYGHYDDK
ncbi:MAG: Txe/YoeB family addiction module toxin [Capnocytophaga sp.]|nr:Txe/YoeB family addiction module toxin [Capnocytophaga sp.]